MWTRRQADGETPVSGGRGGQAVWTERRPPVSDACRRRRTESLSQTPVTPPPSVHGVPRVDGETGPFCSLKFASCYFYQVFVYSHGGSTRTVPEKVHAVEWMFIIIMFHLLEVTFPIVQRSCTYLSSTRLLCLY